MTAAAGRRRTENRRLRTEDRAMAKKAGRKKAAKKTVRRASGAGGGAPGLDIRAALTALAAGRSAAGVARAAGSQAHKRADLARVGRRIIRSLRQRGEILEVFAELGYDVRQFCQHVAERLEATHQKVFCHRGKIIYSKPLSDSNARAEAAEQWMRATGITSLPVETDEAPGGMMDELDDDAAGLLAEILAQLVADSAPRADRPAAKGPA